MHTNLTPEPGSPVKRLVLFDIDGTLLSARGVPRLAFGGALEDVFGTTGPIDDHKFDGKTDPQIARELLRLAGRSDAEIDSGLPRLWERYIGRLQSVLETREHQILVYPGVCQLLDRLEERQDEAVLGLLTGNIGDGARLKLEFAGIRNHFRVGAYGSDHERRDRLPAVAVRRARDLTGVHFRAADVVIVGDTPADMSCGRSIAVRAIGVLTGRYDQAELEAAGAHQVFPDLSATEEVLAAILS
jgi:phosphoglycolate phosphatase-like HAD superfamily hydrolase